MNKSSTFNLTICTMILVVSESVLSYSNFYSMMMSCNIRKINISFRWGVQEKCQNCYQWLQSAGNKGALQGRRPHARCCQRFEKRRHVLCHWSGQRFSLLQSKTFTFLGFIGLSKIHQIPIYELSLHKLVLIFPCAI